jgi:hypothetical protein
MHQTPWVFGQRCLRFGTWRQPCHRLPLSLLAITAAAAATAAMAAMAATVTATASACVLQVVRPATWARVTLVSLPERNTCQGTKFVIFFSFAPFDNGFVVFTKAQGNPVPARPLPRAAARCCPAVPKRLRLNPTACPCVCFCSLVVSTHKPVVFLFSRFQAYANKYAAVFNAIRGFRSTEYKPK